jgi:hypothetical protein
MDKVVVTVVYGQNAFRKRTKINDIILYLVRMFNIKNIKFKKPKKLKKTLVGINSLEVKLLTLISKKFVYHVIQAMILKK